MDKHQRYRLKDIEAYRQRKRDYTKTDDQKEKRRIYMQRWRAKNREKSNQARRDYHQRNKDIVNAKQKIRHLQQKYNLTEEELQEMIKLQGGKCRLCGKEPKSDKVRGLHVDHSHETGRFRALLCISCNTTLGQVESIGISKFELYINEFRE